MARACEQQDVVSSALNVNSLGLNIYNGRGNRVHLAGVYGSREYYMIIWHHRGKANGKGKRDLIKRIALELTQPHGNNYVCFELLYLLD